MDQVEKEFKGKVLKTLKKGKYSFTEIFDAFKKICSSMNLEKREDLQLFSIIIELDSFEFYFSLYYHIIQLSDGTEVDYSKRLDLTVWTDDDYPEMDERYFKEVAMNLDEAFSEIERAPIYKFLKDKNVNLYSEYFI